MARLLFLLALACPAAAEDAGARLREEPVYASKAPRYAVVTMGAKESRWIWVVVDGTAVFVDRDGDGRIRSPEDRLEAGVHGYFYVDVSGCSPEDRPGRFRMTLDVASDDRNRVGLRMLSITAAEDIQDFHTTAGFIPLAARPDQAPRIHVHGPLRFVLMDHWTGSTSCRRLPANGGEHEFSILVATPVLGVDGEAYVYPNLHRLQGNELPKVSMSIESKRGVVTSPTLRTWFCECGRRYRASLVAPPGADLGSASLSVSFPTWKRGELAPATFDVTPATPNANVESSSPDPR